jgi:hypothetical protein
VWCFFLKRSVLFECCSKTFIIRLCTNVTVLPTKLCYYDGGTCWRIFIHVSQTCLQSVPVPWNVSWNHCVCYGCVRSPSHSSHSYFVLKTLVVLKQKYSVQQVRLAVTLLTGIPEVPASNLSRDTACPEIFLDILSSSKQMPLYYIN